MFSLWGGSKGALFLITYPKQVFFWRTKHYISSNVINQVLFTSQLTN